MRSVLLSICAIGLVSGLFVGPVDATDLTVPIVIAPSTINLASDEGVWVTVHAEISYGLVDGAMVTLDGIAVKATFADNRGDLVAKFVVGDVKKILKVGTTQLTLSGSTKLGVTFSGTDTIKVINVSGKK